MIAKNYYNVLGLNPSCAPQDIKKSYHKLALVWHPDKHNNKSEAQSKFTEINEAYSILADSKKRMIYDTCGPEGLVRDQELRDFANCNQNNTFYQKGFQGTDKSAFDVLRDIFEESDDEDDDFFEDCNLFNLSDNFKDNLKAFIDEMIPSESEEDFKNYIPTFMDADFLCHSSLFEQVIPDGDDCSAHTEFFSYFTSSLDTDDIQNFSKKSNKNKNAKKKKTQKEDIIYEEAEFDEYIELGPRPSKKTKNDKSKYVEEVVLDEEDFAELFEKHNNKNDKKKSKKQNKQSKEAQGNGKVKGRLHSELDDEEEKGKKYNQKNQKKNKK